MRMRQPHVALAALLSCLAFATLQAAPPATRPAMQRASCVLRIQYDNERYGPASTGAQTLVAALTSTALIDPAMKAVLALEPSEWPDVAQVDVQAVGESAAKLTVTVRGTAERPVEDGAAYRLLDEITGRALRSFNGGDATTRAADLDATLADLQSKRAALDAKAAELRNELTRMMAETQRRDPSLRIAQQAALEQQVADQRTEIHVQQATIQVIEEQLPKLPTDDSAEMKTLRAHLLSQQIDARIAIAKADARLADLQNRLNELVEKASSNATQPARTPMMVQNELNDLSTQRNLLDQQVAQLMNRRSEQPQNKGKLVVLDGSRQ